eukprot:GHVU01172811.1.p1 GENE.GHVU01172811.1~~GHVU01172811.1.p1  ORF type:complete len:309 (+),score=45.82 GHVU01172811.1:96-1022(+)
MSPAVADNNNHPLVVSYMFSRQCNYKCKFCFHTAKSLESPSLGDSFAAIDMLRKGNFQKISFCGGEPFLSKDLGRMCRHAKEVVGFPSVSIISNGSKITEAWLAEFGKYVDILTVSCDSFDRETNRLHGREDKKDTLEHLTNVVSWCKQFDVRFKLNSVITKLNYREDMAANVMKINPMRWKVFQVLLIEGENTGGDCLRDARDLVVTPEEFDEFVSRHSGVAQMVPEKNEEMKDSYVILDEKLRFLNCQSGMKVPTRSIMDVGVEEALKEAGYDHAAFLRRGGAYEWRKSNIEDKLSDVVKCKEDLC